MDDDDDDVPKWQSVRVGLFRLFGVDEFGEICHEDGVQYYDPDDGFRSKVDRGYPVVGRPLTIKDDTHSLMKDVSLKLTVEEKMTLELECRVLDEFLAARPVDAEVSRCRLYGRAQDGLGYTHSPGGKYVRKEDLRVKLANEIVEKYYPEMDEERQVVIKRMNLDRFLGE